MDHRHESPRPPPAPAREFGATDIIEARGDDAPTAVKDLTGGLGSHGVAEAVGTHEAMLQAIRSTRPGGSVGFVGYPIDVALPADELFWSRRPRCSCPIHPCFTDLASDKTDRAWSALPDAPIVDDRRAAGSLPTAATHVVRRLLRGGITSAAGAPRPSCTATTTTGRGLPC